jgi:hypothetical protein
LTADAVVRMVVTDPLAQFMDITAAEVLNHSCFIC